MPELERYVLHLTAELDERLKRALDDYDFNPYVRGLTDFCNEDLSAFYFDIRKDVLYCEVNAETGVQTGKRRANRTVLDILFHALVRWLSPVLVFTSEEVWGTRYPEAGSVHLLEWPEIPEFAELLSSAADEFSQSFQEISSREETADPTTRFLEKWAKLRSYRSDVNEAIEPLRRDKLIGSSLEAEVTLDPHPSEIPGVLERADLPELFISSEVRIVNEVISEPYVPGRASEARIVVKPTDNHKCGRCWRYLPEVKSDGELCGRCEDVLNG
jgi:isoleucyl-tRNA synthetase